MQEMHQNTIISQNPRNNWLILSPSKWDDLKVSNHFITKELSFISKNVIYVESPGVIGLSIKRIFSIFFSYFRNNLMNKKIINNIINHKEITKKIDKETNLIIFKNKIIPFIGFPLIDKIIFKINDKFKKSIYEALNHSNKVLICSPIWLPIYFDWLKKNKNKASLCYFNIVDDFESYSHLKYYMNIFNSNINSFNLIISPNQFLLKKYGKVNINYHLPHGFNKVHDEKVYLREILRGNNIVYAGTFANWLDYKLIDQICKKFPLSKIYLVGKLARNISFKVIHDLCKKNENCIIINPMERIDLHTFLLSCSIAIIPYKSHLLHIKNCSPSKIMDYLGCGLPIISSDIPYCRSHEYVNVAESSKNFLNKIEDAFNISNEERRRFTYYALNNTWNKKIRKLLHDIETKKLN